MAKIKKYELFINDEYVTSDANIVLRNNKSGYFEFTVFPHNSKFKEVEIGKNIKIELKEDDLSIFSKMVEIIDGTRNTFYESIGEHKKYHLDFNILDDLIPGEKYYFHDWASMFYKEFYFQEELDDGQCLGYTLSAGKKVYGIVKKEDIITDVDKSLKIKTLNNLKKEKKEISDRLYEIQEEIRVIENEL